MMRKTITRSMSTSKISACVLTVKDGKPSVETLEPLTVMGKATEKEALKMLKEKHGKNTAITVTGIEVTEETYEISVDDFVKYATKVQKVTNNTESSVTV